jgi:hypothetical protein
MIRSYTREGRGDTARLIRGSGRVAEVRQLPSTRRIPSGPVRGDERLAAGRGTHGGGPARREGAPARGSVLNPARPIRSAGPTRPGRGRARPGPPADPSRVRSRGPTLRIRPGMGTCGRSASAAGPDRSRSRPGRRPCSPLSRITVSWGPWGPWGPWGAWQPHRDGVGCRLDAGDRGGSDRGRGPAGDRIGVGRVFEPDSARSDRVRTASGWKARPTPEPPARLSPPTRRAEVASVRARRTDGRGAGRAVRPARGGPRRVARGGASRTGRRASAGSSAPDPEATAAARRPRFRDETGQRGGRGGRGRRSSDRLVLFSGVSNHENADSQEFFQLSQVPQ